MRYKAAVKGRLSEDSVFFHKAQQNAQIRKMKRRKSSKEGGFEVPAEHSMLSPRDEARRREAEAKANNRIGQTVSDGGRKNFFTTLREGFRVTTSRSDSAAQAINKKRTHSTITGRSNMVEPSKALMRLNSATISGAELKVSNHNQKKGRRSSMLQNKRSAMRMMSPSKMSFRTTQAGMVYNNNPGNIASVDAGVGPAGVANGGLGALALDVQTLKSEMDNINSKLNEILDKMSHHEVKVENL